MATMPRSARCDFDFFAELTLSPERIEPAVHRTSIEDDLADLVDDALVGALLADEVSISPALDDVRIEIAPVWIEPPIAQGIEVSIITPGHGGACHRHAFQSGRWLRRAKAKATELVAGGTIGEHENVYVRLVAEGRRQEAALRLGAGEPPDIVDQSLDELGVRELGAEPLCADRPVLVNSRMVEQILRETEAAGPTEVGGGVIGKIIRLEQPLPGTTTRVVTVLTAAVSDPRHAGTVARVTFDPDALANAAQVAALRARGERVLTAYHSHGWGTECGRCNHNHDCLIPSASYVSPDDYRVLESLFASKATVMPIAGRKLGAEVDRPVLEVHAWRAGRMEPIAWRAYQD